MIKAESIKKSLRSLEGEIRILDGVELAIERTQSVAITGASGSGKSTLLGILAGLDSPTSGYVWLDDTEITALDEDARAAIRGRSVGFVFQSFQLLPALMALENVMLPLELKGVRNAREMAADFLGRVGLADRLHHYPRQLSGGEQQRVAIARAFANSPKILFADEPTGNLDTETGQIIIDLIFDLNRESGTTLVMVTHDRSLSERCQRHFELIEGRVNEVGS
jgi:putative ABC transport system ATP-binding protein